MLFHTWTFFVFFLVFYPLYVLTRNTGLRIFLLLVASYIFYGWWDARYLALIAFSTVIDWVSVLMMSRGGRRMPWLAMSLVGNLGLLAFFKYAAFITENANALLRGIGFDVSLPVPDLVLPVGISFFVFQSMSYTIDYYRGQVGTERSLVRYAAFVSLFPQLVAGPIERAKNLLPQLRQTPRITRQDIGDGLSLFLVGLFKKAILADSLSLYVDRVYGAPQEFQAPALFLATVAFGWQIYFDFSGYTDMARGLARLMGIRLMLNFNHPYTAVGLGDFWRRWHISLSTWFRDYVYIPLGGSREGKWATYRNMFLTMVISGLWHGANWTFVAWGALHGLGRMLTRTLEESSFYRNRVPQWVKRAWVFLFVTFAWIFFRAQSIRDAWVVVKGIFSFEWSDPGCPLLLLGLILAVWAYQLVYESRRRWVLTLRPVRLALAVCMLLALLFWGTGTSAFIYFQF